MALNSVSSCLDLRTAEITVMFLPHHFSLFFKLQIIYALISIEVEFSEQLFNELSNEQLSSESVTAEGQGR
jgi:hypothetical protein